MTIQGGAVSLSDASLREIAKIFRRHVDRKTLEKIVDDLLDIRGDKNFRDTIAALTRELNAKP
jgi:ppGpp synthetase/RelA/SpoT-type nucleotidyltranferase